MTENWLAECIYRMQERGDARPLMHRGIECLGQVWSAQGVLTCLFRPAADGCRPCALLSLLVFNQRGPIAWQQSLGGCQLQRAVPNQALLPCSRRHRAAAAAGEALHNGTDRNTSQKTYILGYLRCSRRRRAAAAARDAFHDGAGGNAGGLVFRRLCAHRAASAAPASRRLRCGGGPWLRRLRPALQVAASLSKTLIAIVAAPAPRRLRRGGASRLRRLRLALQVPRIQLSACRFGGRRCCGHGPA